MIDKHSAEHDTWGQHCDGWHLLRLPTLSIIHERMPPGTVEIRHAHQHARQFFFVLSGTATFELASDVQRLGAQHGIAVEPGVPHQMRNDSAEPLEFMVISQPPSHGDRIVVS